MDNSYRLLYSCSAEYTGVEFVVLEGRVKHGEDQEEGRRARWVRDGKEEICFSQWMTCRIPVRTYQGIRHKY